VGILKYRLYEIDRIISRTLAYAIVTGLLVGVYAGLVLVATEVLRFHSSVAVAVSTLAAAALFNPLRRRVQRAVDHRFNRARYDADQTVTAFAARLKDAVELDSVRDELAAGVGKPMVGASHIDYDVVMSKRAATPVRFDPAVADRLASFVAANPGMSLSSAANRLVDEALRMAEHPGVIFRSGPTGRRAALAAGPDVWEVIRAVKSAHAAEPGLNSDDLVGLVSDNTGVALRRVNTAVRYWAAYPGEVDAEIAAADAAEEAAEQAWRRERQLLAG
jgi:hypothetical protein